MCTAKESRACLIPELKLAALETLERKKKDNSRDVVAQRARWSVQSWEKKIVKLRKLILNRNVCIHSSNEPKCCNWDKKRRTQKNKDVIACNMQTYSVFTSVLLLLC